MKRIIKLTESDLSHIVRRVIREEEASIKKTNIPPNKICDYFLYQTNKDKHRVEMPDYVVHPDFIYFDLYYRSSKGGGDTNVLGKKRWLQSNGLDIFGAGNQTESKFAAKKLYYGVTGLDITGAGAKAIKEFVGLWEKMDINTQNQFLRDWKRMYPNEGNFIQGIRDDNEIEMVDKILDISHDKIYDYCYSYIRQLEDEWVKDHKGYKD